MGGGAANSATTQWSTVGGGSVNTASGQRATVVGGTNNVAGGDWSFVGGGYYNSASSGYATVAGGSGNFASSQYATAAGGQGNFSTGAWSTIGGGSNNLASGITATVAGGANNNANTTRATVGGGTDNTAGGLAATVGGGQNNLAGGNYATVPGGLDNRASGDGSVAMGSHARATLFGSFVFADVSTATPLTTTSGNQFLVRASGGVSFTTNSAATVGASLAPGSGSWTTFSDRNAKANFAAVDGVEILNRLTAMPIQTWNYQTQDAAIRHMGPMAQDFSAVFGLGESETGISTVDADGVALAAIQGLYTVVQEKDAALAEQSAAIAALTERVAALEAQAEAPQPGAAGGYGQLLLGLALGAGIAAGAFLLGRAASRKA